MIERDRAKGRYRLVCDDCGVSTTEWVDSFDQAVQDGRDEGFQFERNSNRRGQTFDHTCLDCYRANG